MRIVDFSLSYIYIFLITTADVYVRFSQPSYTNTTNVGTEKPKIQFSTLKGAILVLVSLTEIYPIIRWHRKGKKVGGGDGDQVKDRETPTYLLRLTV